MRCLLSSASEPHRLPACCNFNVTYQIVFLSVSTAVCTASRILSQLYQIAYESLLKDECKH